MADLSPEERYQARQLLEAGKGCVHCGGVHTRACPRVSKISWHPDGTLIGAEYWPREEWDDDGIVWPEDAYDDDEADGSSR